MQDLNNNEGRCAPFYFFFAWVVVCLSLFFEFFPFLSSLFLPYILYNNVSILPSSRFPASFLVFVTNLLSVYLQNIFIILGKNLREYLVFVGIRCTFAPAFGKGASLFERSVSVFRFPRLFFQKKKTSGKIWKICEKVLNFAAAFASWRMRKREILERFT